MKVVKFQILLFVFYTVSFCLKGLSQKIDYAQFDTRRASLVLFEKINKFRDTITQTGYGKDLDSAWPCLKNNHKILQLTWSEKLYYTVVLPNTLDNVKQKKLFHVDRTEWWMDKSNQALFMDEVYPTKNKGFRLTLSENGGYTTRKFETYQELADHMIMCWESSFMHKCAQRGLLKNSYFYEKGYESKTIAATCVICSEGICYFFVDFVY